MSASRTGAALPALGRRGEGWVLLQVALVAAVVVTGLLGGSWPAAARPWLLAASVPLALVGLALFLGGGRGLGRQLTPFPKPVAGGGLRRDGAYRFVRHPMYGGVLLIVLAWALVSAPLALVPWALAALFLEAKCRREEAWLVEQHPGYEEYQRSVRRRFVPFVH